MNIPNLRSFGVKNLFLRSIILYSKEGRRSRVLVARLNFCGLGIGLGCLSMVSVLVSNPFCSGMEAKKWSGDHLKT